MGYDKLTGDLLRRLVKAAAAALEEQKEAVNALNVFPVPDGDTGTNMSLTMQAAVREIDKCVGLGVGDVGRALSMGSLMGARGNSGVILSQLFRGIGRGLEGHAELDGTGVARALQLGVETAYKAVMRPVEGTILTVAREMGRSAAKAAREQGSISEVFHAATAGGEVALARTPELLPVLKQAGVVDAGGKGLVILFTGMAALLEGQRAVVRALPSQAGSQPAVAEAFRITEDLEDIVYTYDTQLLIRGKGLELNEVRERIGPLGDSMLVVGTAEIAKVHIHTNNPGRVLELCLAHGDLTDISIDNMREQYEAVKRARSGGDGGVGGQAAGSAGVMPGAEQAKEVGVVCVSVGEGMEKIHRSLGVDIVIDGGQTMNPSTEELVLGIESASTEQVILLPNNSNILMAAQQALQLTSKKVAVVPSRNMPQGISALLAYNPQANLETNQSRMAAAMRETRTGEITYAVRSTRHDQLEINEGDILAVADDRILAVGKEPNTVLEQLIDALLDDSREFITVFYGLDVTAADAEAAMGLIQDRHPEVEVELHYGGQPLFYYLISVE
ncbi:MAG: DAK2 domain-containing protein [Bacillota bacterium]|nr:DAK2 domain-containing protein [Bacillota bacterium]